MNLHLPSRLGALIVAACLLTSLSACSHTDSNITFNPPTSQPPTTDTETPPPAQTSCPNGVVLPDGVDASLVCGPPTSSITLPSFTVPAISDAPVYGFVTSDGSVACTWFEAGTVACKGVEMDVDYPSDPKTANSEGDCDGRGMYIADDGTGMVCNGGVLNIDMIPDIVTPPTLAVGQTVVSTDYPSDYYMDTPPLDQVACNATDQAVTCWDTVNSHGFVIGTETAIFW